jgi:hypothetical protein
MVTYVLNRSVSVVIDNLEAKIQLLPEIKNYVEILAVTRIQIVLNNICTIYFNPVRLRSLPLHFEDDLGVRFVTAGVHVLKLMTLHIHLKDPELCLTLKFFGGVV